MAASSLSVRDRRIRIGSLPLSKLWRKPRPAAKDRSQFTTSSPFVSPIFRNTKRNEKVEDPGKVNSHLDGGGGGRAEAATLSVSMEEREHEATRTVILCRKNIRAETPK
jgi:hypothetical protein